MTRTARHLLTLMLGMMLWLGCAQAQGRSGGQVKESRYRQTVFPLDREAQLYAESVKAIEQGEEIPAWQVVANLGRYYKEKARESLPIVQKARQVRMSAGLTEPSVPEKRYDWMLQVSAHLERMSSIPRALRRQELRDPLLAPVIDVEKAPEVYEQMREQFKKMRANDPARDAKE